MTRVDLRLEHSIPALGYCLVEDDHPGRFDPDEARALGIPEGPQWGALQRAHDPRVTGPPRRGRRIAYADARLHATAAGAARVAAEAGAGLLILTHFSTRYLDVSPLLAEARAIFANTEAAHDFAEFAV